MSIRPIGFHVQPFSLQVVMKRDSERISNAAVKQPQSDESVNQNRICQQLSSTKTNTSTFPQNPNAVMTSAPLNELINPTEPSKHSINETTASTHQPANNLQPAPAKDVGDASPNNAGFLRNGQTIGSVIQSVNHLISGMHALGFRSNEGSTEQAQNGSDGFLKRESGQSVETFPSHSTKPSGTASNGSTHRPFPPSQTIASPPKTPVVTVPVSVPVQGNPSPAPITMPVSPPNALGHPITGQTGATTQIGGIGSTRNGGVSPSDPGHNFDQVLNQAMAILMQQMSSQTETRASLSVEPPPILNPLTPLREQNRTLLHNTLFGSQMQDRMFRSSNALALGAAQNGFQALALEKAAQEFQRSQFMATRILTNQAHSVLGAISNLRDALNPAMGMQYDAQGLAGAMKSVVDGYNGLVSGIETGSQFIEPGVVSMFMKPISSNVYGSFIAQTSTGYLSFGQGTVQNSVSSIGVSPNSLGNFLNQLESRVQTIATRPMETFTAPNPYEGAAALVRQYGAQFYSNMSKVLFNQEVVHSMFNTTA